MSIKTGTDLTYKPTPMTNVVVPSNKYRNTQSNRFMSAT